MLLSTIFRSVPLYLRPQEFADTVGFTSWGNCVEYYYSKDFYFTISDLAELLLYFYRNLASNTVLGKYIVVKVRHLYV